MICDDCSNDWVSHKHVRQHGGGESAQELSFEFGGLLLERQTWDHWKSMWDSFNCIKFEGLKEFRWFRLWLRRHFPTFRAIEVWGPLFDDTLTTKERESRLKDLSGGDAMAATGSAAYVRTLFLGALRQRLKEVRDFEVDDQQIPALMCKWFALLNFLNEIEELVALCPSGVGTVARRVVGTLNQDDAYHLKHILIDHVVPHECRGRKRLNLAEKQKRLKQHSLKATFHWGLVVPAPDEAASSSGDFLIRRDLDDLHIASALSFLLRGKYFDNIAPGTSQTRLQHCIAAQLCQVSDDDGGPALASVLNKQNLKISSKKTLVQRPQPNQFEQYLSERGLSPEDALSKTSGGGTTVSTWEMGATPMDGGMNTTAEAIAANDDDDDEDYLQRKAEQEASLVDVDLPDYLQDVEVARAAPPKNTRVAQLHEMYLQLLDRDEDAGHHLATVHSLRFYDRRQSSGRWEGSYDANEREGRAEAFDGVSFHEGTTSSRKVGNVRRGLTDPSKKRGTASKKRSALRSLCGGVLMEEEPPDLAEFADDAWGAQNPLLDIHMRRVSAEKSRSSSQRGAAKMDWKKFHEDTEVINEVFRSSSRTSEEERSEVERRLQSKEITEGEALVLATCRRTIGTRLARESRQKVSHGSHAAGLSASNKIFPSDQEWQRRGQHGAPTILFDKDATACMRFLVTPVGDSLHDPHFRRRAWTWLSRIVPYTKAVLKKDDLTWCAALVVGTPLIFDRESSLERSNASWKQIWQQTFSHQNKRYPNRRIVDVFEEDRCYCLEFRSREGNRRKFPAECDAIVEIARHFDHPGPQFGERRSRRPVQDEAVAPAPITDTTDDVSLEQPGPPQGGAAASSSSAAGVSERELKHPQSLLDRNSSSRPVPPPPASTCQSSDVVGDSSSGEGNFGFAPHPGLRGVDEVEDSAESAVECGTGGEQEVGRRFCLERFRAQKHDGDRASDDEDHRASDDEEPHRARKKRKIDRPIGSEMSESPSIISDIRRDLLDENPDDSCWSDNNDSDDFISDDSHVEVEKRSATAKQRKKTQRDVEELKKAKANAKEELERATANGAKKVIKPKAKSKTMPKAKPKTMPKAKPKTMPKAKPKAKSRPKAKAQQGWGEHAVGRSGK